MEEEYIKLIFGLKLRQVRNDRDLSLFGLSKLTGMSKSYLNEIENGKKYPKPDKIATLAERLDVPYDQMVSLKLDKNLAPVGDLLKSNILKEIPLELFGIKENTLIDIVANAPIKVNAFISTIIQIAQHYDLSKESFYLAALRSFQEANNNYFNDLEEAVASFARAYHIDLSKKRTADELEEILMEEYGYHILRDELSQHQLLGQLRSVFVPKTKSLLLTDAIDDAQRSFIYAKEIAYNYLNITERLHTFPWIKFQGFDQVLNNFYASYFAGALVLTKKTLSSSLKELFSKKHFNNQVFEKMLLDSGTSPETFFQRLTNILPKEFNLSNLFFLRFTHQKNVDIYSLNKELHLSHQHSPRANESNEHYCRRWVSIDVLRQITSQEKHQVFDLQISHYPKEKVSYLVLSSATKDPFKEGHYRSVSIGLLINNQLKRKLNFINSDQLVTKDVGVTCERCAIMDCDLRKAAPRYLEKEKTNLEIENLVDQLQKKFS